VAAGRRSEVGAHWAGLVELMPLYRSISTPIVGDGQRTSFWEDDWLGIGALRHTMPVLFSHATKPRASIAAVLEKGVRESLVTRLTVEAERELAHVMRLLETVQLSNTPDSRSLVRRSKKGGELAVGDLYAAADRRDRCSVRQLCLGQLCPVESKILRLAFAAHSNSVASRAASEAYSHGGRGRVRHLRRAPRDCRPHNVRLLLREELLVCCWLDTTRGRQR
jgi:hypothetical protein